MHAAELDPARGRQLLPNLRQKIRGRVPNLQEDLVRIHLDFKFRAELHETESDQVACCLIPRGGIDRLRRISLTIGQDEGGGGRQKSGRKQDASDSQQDSPKESWFHWAQSLVFSTTRMPPMNMPLSTALHMS